MGTGYVALWLLRLFRICRRCLSPFSDRECRPPWKMGTGRRFAALLGAAGSAVVSSPRVAHTLALSDAPHPANLPRINWRPDPRLHADCFT